MKKLKRVLVLSDFHCGSIVGLTPPKYFNCHSDIQKILWDFYIEKLKIIGPVDLCVLVGDLVDGRGKKGTRQHLTTDLKEQTEIAIATLEQVKTKKFSFVRGTPFHVEDNMECEDLIAEHFDAEIADERKIDVNGCIIHCKHTTGKGSTPYGSVTSLQAGAINKLLADCVASKIPADIFIRGHAHEYICLERALYTAIVLPALQMKGLAYGRRYSGAYDVGVLWIDIVDKNDFTVNKFLLQKDQADLNERILKI
jgi:Icc-related predicted phosphoesterase